MSSVKSDEQSNKSNRLDESRKNNEPSSEDEFQVSENLQSEHECESNNVEQSASKKYDDQVYDARLAKRNRKKLEGKSPMSKLLKKLIKAETGDELVVPSVDAPWRICVVLFSEIVTYLIILVGIVSVCQNMKMRVLFDYLIVLAQQTLVAILSVLVYYSYDSKIIIALFSLSITCVITAQLLYNIPFVFAWVYKDITCTQSFQFLPGVCVAFMKLHELEKEACIVLGLLVASMNFLALLLVASHLLYKSRPNKVPFRPRLKTPKKRLPLKISYTKWIRKVSKEDIGISRKSPKEKNPIEGMTSSKIISGMSSTNSTMERTQLPPSSKES